MKRIMIVGQPGSGKSTLARTLGQGLSLPVVHMDHIHWKPGWQERPLKEKIPLIRAEEEEPQWIIEGGLSSTYETRLARADTLVWLDRAWPLRLARTLQRSWQYRGTTRPDLPQDCPEFFGKQTIEFVLFIIRTRHKNRRRLAGLADAARGAGKDVFHLKTDAQAKAWLRELGLSVPVEWQSRDN